MLTGLKRPGALFFVLLASLLVTSAAFLAFLKIDQARMHAAFASGAVEAAANGASYAERFFDHIVEYAAVSPRLEFSRISPVAWLAVADLLPLASLICERIGNETTVLHPEHDERPRSDCEKDERLPVSLDTPASGDVRQIDLLVSRNTDVGAHGQAIAAAPSGSHESGQIMSLAIEVPLTATHAIIYELDRTVLLDSFRPRRERAAGFTSDLCLFLIVVETSLQVACDERSFASSDTAQPLSQDADEHVQFKTNGTVWDIVSRPHAANPRVGVTETPFIVMAGTALLCGLICWSVYRSLVRNRRLDLQNRQLALLLARLEQQNQDLDQFATMAAHDLQAPLRFMVNQAHLLEMDIEELDRPDLQAIVEHIIAQGGRMHELMLDLLAFCRAGQDEMDVVPINPQELINNEIVKLKTNKDYRHSEVSVGDLPTSVLADRRKFALIISNLLDNAMKFSLQNEIPRVGIEASRPADTELWQFVVSDNGCGIESAHRERVFRPFNRLDTTHEGTGVGLAIVRKLVERHHGKIWITSAGSGGGTSVSFTLPNNPAAELHP